MFKHTVFSASLIAGALAGPLAARNGHKIVSSHESSSSFHEGSSFHDIGSLSIVPIIAIDGLSFDSHSSSVVEFSSHHSFNNFGGLSSLSGFDDFFGSENFCGFNNVQVFDNSRIETCHPTLHINTLQQQLSILGEYAKRLILTQTCETEAQVLLFSQWLSGLTSFSNDLRRQSHREVSFDHNIASHITNLCDSNLVINVNPFEFSGSEIGSQSVRIIGGNWGESSPISVGVTWQSAQSAAGFQNIPLVGNCIGSSCSSGLSLPPFVQQQCSLQTCSGVLGGSGVSSLPPFGSPVSSGSSIPQQLPPQDVSSGSSQILPPQDVSSGSSQVLPPQEVSSGSSGIDLSGGAGVGTNPVDGSSIPLLTGTPAGSK